MHIEIMKVLNSNCKYIVNINPACSWLKLQSELATLFEVWSNTVNNMLSGVFLSLKLSARK